MLRKLNFIFNFTITGPLLSAQCGRILVISFTWISILQIEPFNFGKRPFGIISFFLNKILREISAHSSLFHYFNIFGTEKFLSIFETTRAVFLINLMLKLPTFPTLKVDSFDTHFFMRGLFLCFLNESRTFWASVSDILTLMYWISYCKVQKHLFVSVLMKRCSKNIQQFYRRASIPKCDFSKVAKQLHWNRTLVWVFSCKFAAYFQNTFL